MCRLRRVACNVHTTEGAVSGRVGEFLCANGQPLETVVLAEAALTSAGTIDL